MRKFLVMGLLIPFAGCGAGEQAQTVSDAVVFHGSPSVTVNEATNTICVSADLSGLGNTDVNVDMSATFTATTVCRNNGGNVAPGQGTVTLNQTFPTQTFEPKNGRARFTACTSPISGSNFQTPTSQEAGCPNGNWTVDPILTSNITISSYNVTLTWDGQVLYTASGP